jgi:uncharacterized protein YaaR (DUF327 family)
MVSLNPLSDIAEAGEDLRKKATEKPVEVYNELEKMMKPVIKMGNEQGFDVKPEKKLYKKLKDIEPAQQPEKLESVIASYVEERTDA